MATKKTDKTEKVTVEEELILKKGITVASAEADDVAKIRAAADAAEETAEEVAEMTAGENAEDTASGAERWYPHDPGIDSGCRQFYIDSEYSDGSNIPQGAETYLEAKARNGRADSMQEYEFMWTVTGGFFKDEINRRGGLTTEIYDAASVELVALGTDANVVVILAAKFKRLRRDDEQDSFEGKNDFREVCRLRLTRQADARDIEEEIHNLNETIKTTPNFNRTVPVSLQRTTLPPDGELGLWFIIRNSSQALSFNRYKIFMNQVLCPAGGDRGDDSGSDAKSAFKWLRKRRRLPFNDTDAYRLLKVATEAFLLTNGAVALDGYKFDLAAIRSIEARVGGRLPELNELWDDYLTSVNGERDPMLPYLAMVSNQFDRKPLRSPGVIGQQDKLGFSRGKAENCLSFLSDKVAQPFLVELIWSYWHEEGMLVQTMNAIARRFQNIRTSNGSRDPLANLEIDPLRGLNNLLWGYVQDEQHRLSLVRRVYEYDHHYGIALQGRAIPKLRPADSRSKFLEAFHHLLHLASVFYKQDDDTTVNPDGFPLLNALREVHLILSQGAHNQFGDLPSTARQEMLIQQWLLARPEFREFLPTRNMVAYPEPWMNRVDAMKSLQGWTDISIDHFNRLGVFGEQILLSVRFGAWSGINQSSSSAANWARFWRAEIQGYIHDYRAVTGVDLASSSRVDSTPPSVHLFNRYMAQQARR